MQITHSIIQIELLTEQLDEVEDTINDIMDSMDSVIKTIPGISNLNVCMIIGEIGDIHRFESPCKLLAYAGLDPSVYQSGKLMPLIPKCLNVFLNFFAMLLLMLHGS